MMPLPALEFPMWICFHCGFASNDPADAAAHFGDRDEEEPLCRTWAELNADERLRAFQDLTRELDGEREEAQRQRTQIEGLEHRLLEFESLLGSRFKGCRTINDAFNLYDSMEGRALAAEEALKAANASPEAEPNPAGGKQ